MLKTIFLPWLVIADQRHEIIELDRTNLRALQTIDRLNYQIATLKAQIAAFDHDKDGKVGGSKKKAKP